MDAGGFDLTLVARPDVSPARSLHFGVRVGDSDSVRRLRNRLFLESVETGDLFENDRRVAFHCSDPDGYQVEVFWEDRPGS